jgi:hypothetical protein
MSDLSPAALAVWHAYATADCDPYEIDPRQAGVAAALRAAAEQLGYFRAPGADFEDLYGHIVDVDDLLALATELEQS